MSNHVGGLSVGGLASGLDTTAIINGLIQIETQRVVRAEKKKSDIELKLSTFNELKTKLTDFYNQSKEMDKSTIFNVFKSSSSDSTVATITGESNATQGNYDVKVVGLANSLKVASKSYTSSNTSLAMTGAFSLSVSAAALKADPTVTNVQVDISATDTLKDIAAKINRTKGTGATAAVIQMGVGDFRLMVTAVDEGSKAFTMDHVSGQGALSNGLDFVTEATAAAGRKSLRTDFDFRLSTGGPASSTSTFSSLFNSIGLSSAITNNDYITITGTKADGTAALPTNFTIANPDTSTLGDLLTSIQAAYGGPAVVDVTLNSSGEVVVLDKTLGTTAMTLTMVFKDPDNSNSKLGVGASTERSEFKNVIADGKKAFYLLNDMSVSAQTNRDNTTVAGTVFELKKVDTTQKVKLTLDYDKDGIKQKVQTYLDSYNQLLKFIDEKSKIEVKQDEDKSTPGAKGKARINKGPFAGDSSILGLKSQLQGMMTSKITELTDQGLSKFSSLASMGILSEQKTGFLTIDDEDFSAALDQDFEGVKRVFVTNGYMSNSAHTFGTYTKDTKTGVYDFNPATLDFDTDATSVISFATATTTGAGDVLNSNAGDSTGMAVQAASASGTGKVTFVRGVAGQIKDFYDKITNFVDGFVTSTAKNYSDRIRDEETRIARLEKQVAGVKDRLTRQFANLELSISKLQSQSSAFSGQIRR
ncbi:MAG: flagellar filament capping protein FliD [Fibrobacterota bacterium]|nr:flagellar filament capping protein FliD [Fibrobacterota bacterium]